MGIFILKGLQDPFTLLPKSSSVPLGHPAHGASGKTTQWKAEVLWAGWKSLVDCAGPATPSPPPPPACRVWILSAVNGMPAWRSLTEKER